MTQGKDFKALVRSRMRQQNESYTAARAVLLVLPPPEDTQWHVARRDQQLIIDRWFVDGRLRSIPARRKVRAAVLLEVLTRFTPGIEYAESEVSRRLQQIHLDFAYLRRELVGFGYLERQSATYWVCRMPPTRTDQQRRELPAWEESWLPGFVAGADRRGRTVR